MQALSDHHVYLEGSLLKPNMVTPGQVRLLLELQTKVREYFTWAFSFSRFIWPNPKSYFTFKTLLKQAHKHGK